MILMKKSLRQIVLIFFAQEPNRISQSVLQIPSGCWPQIP